MIDNAVDSLPVTLYLHPHTNSAKKVKKWFSSHGIGFREVNLKTDSLSRTEIVRILRNTNVGVNEVISERNPVLQKIGKSLIDMRISEIIGLIEDNPVVLKQPIILPVDDDLQMQVGYNERSIELFSRHFSKQ